MSRYRNSTVKGRMAVVGGMIQITIGATSLFKQILAEVKQIPYRSWNDRKEIWQAPLTSAAEALAVATKHDFAIPKDSYNEMVLAIAENGRQRTEALLGDMELPEGEKLELSVKKNPRPYQEVGVKFIADFMRVIIGDEMGLGKTITAICACEYIQSRMLNGGAYPAIVVVPKHLLLNWISEFHSWTDKKAGILAGNPTMLFPEFFPVNVINFESLAKYEMLFDSYRTVIIDESHKVRNWNTQRTQTVHRLCMAQNVKHVIQLTGTPVMNKPEEMLSLLRVMGQEKLFGGVDTFRRRYVETNQYHIELSQKLREKVFLRREKYQVAKDIPAKTRQVVPVSIGNRKEYDRAKKDLQDYLTSVKGMNDVQARRAARMQAMAMLMVLRRIAALGKLEQVNDLIRSIVESGEKVVVFLHHREVAAKLLPMVAQYTEFVSIQGGQKNEERNYAVQAFQHDPRVKVIVCSIMAASTGLTLTAASKTVMVEMAWTPGDNDQAEDRIHRIGQEQPCWIYYVMDPDTVEQKIFDAVENKRKIFNEIVRGTTVDAVGFNKQQMSISDLTDKSIQNEILKQFYT